MLNINIKRLRDNAVIPRYAHEGDTGCDLYIAKFKVKKGSFIFIEDKSYTLAPFEKVLCLTGISLEIPQGYDCQIRGTSGNSLKTPINVFLGTIDSGYRGEVGVVVQNVSLEPFTLSIGDKIAQMVFSKHVRANFFDKDIMSVTDRGIRGFGSTGIAGELN